MSNFELFKVDNEIINKYILITTTEDIYYLYDEIYGVLSKDMGTAHFKITVDLFLRNGFTFNRFLVLEFMDGKVKSLVLNPREVPEILKENTKSFLRSNNFILRESALSKSAIDFILSS